MFRALRRLAALAAILLWLGGAARAEPVKLTIGVGPASDFTLYLIQLKPALAPNLNKLYSLSLEQFRGVDLRFRAYIADALDGSTGSANAVVDAGSKGIDLTVVASISKEAGKAFHTEFMVADAGPIRSVADLKGRTLGINAQRSSIELWERLAVEKAGLDPDRDLRFTVVDFPNQGTALRAGQIDLGAFPQPYSALEREKGGVRLLFTSGDAVPFDEEVQILFFHREFLKQHGGAVRGFLADLASVVRYYLDNTTAARQALLDAKIIRLPPATFLAMSDYYRSPDLKVDIDGLIKMQEMQMKAGYQEHAADIPKLVDLGYLPR